MKLAALAGSVAFVVLIPVLGESMAMLLGAGTVLALRLAAMRWKLTLPIFDAQE